MKDILITRDSKGKIRIVKLSYEWNNKLFAYIISRSTCQLGGKTTEQPDITISKGKAKRSVTEQVTLEYNSHLKKYLDKGYKNIKEFGYTSLSEFDPEKVMPEEVVDQNGFKKKMLAKKYSEVALSTFERKHYASRKLDGTRCGIHKSKDNTLVTSSRGGGDYNIPATHILNDDVLQQIFKDEQLKQILNNKPFSLDGELYIHGKPLPYISGLCRKITVEPEHDELMFNMYDIEVDDLPFKTRLLAMQYIKENYVSPKFVISEQILTTSWTEIKRLHDKWVNEGYEGCVIRDPEKPYGYGKKDNRMIKIKEYDDDEFVITGITEKLREEDFVFTLLTKTGKSFEAKPRGTVEQRQEYRKNINNIIGQMGTVQFFGYSPDGIPNLPVFKCVRYNDDIS